MSAQAIEALALANERRSGMARLRREIKALPMREGLDRVAELIVSPPDDDAAALRIDVALLSVRSLGRQKAQRLLWFALDNPSRQTRRIRDLTPRERRVLAAHLREYRCRPKRKEAA